MDDDNSKYPGVCWDKDKEKWKVCIKTGSQVEFLGYYTDEILAANEYNRAMFELGLSETREKIIVKGRILRRK
jgi:hypothetical protein